MDLAALFDLPVVVEELAVGSAPVEELHPAERSAVAKAAPERRAEFFAGRVAARRAQRKLLREGPSGPLLIERDRAPSWPADVIGSITHSGERCVVVVAGEDDAEALGLDLEPWAPLEDDLVALILTPEERAAVQDEPLGLAARRSFCAKEAVYKAVSRRAGRVLEFHEVTIAFEAEIFEARVDPLDLTLTGRWARDDAWVAAGVVLR